MWVERESGAGGGRLLVDSWLFSLIIQFWGQQISSCQSVLVLYPIINSYVLCWKLKGIILFYPYISPMRQVLGTITMSLGEMGNQAKRGQITSNVSGRFKSRAVDHQSQVQTTPELSLVRTSLQLSSWASGAQAESLPFFPAPSPFISVSRFHAKIRHHFLCWHDFL